MQTQSTSTHHQEINNADRISSRDLHKYVWLLVGVFSLLAATYPTAMLRVSQMEKFKGFHVKSAPVAGKLQAESIK
jgi:hypothetical protein